MAPSTTTKKAAAGKGHTPGADLVPDLSRSAPGVTREVFYWVGVFPACPVENLTVAGIAFPKVNEDLRPQPGTNELQRVPHIGGITSLTADKIDTLRERLPRLVLRFRDPNPGDEPMAGSGLQDRQRRARRGQPIHIPTAAAIEAARKAGRTLPRYVASPNDEPAARYMFAVPCEDQEQPRPGGVYPPSLEETGLDWPEE